MNISSKRFDGNGASIVDFFFQIPRNFQLFDFRSFLDFAADKFGVEVDLFIFGVGAFISCGDGWVNLYIEGASSVFFLKNPML